MHNVLRIVVGIIVAQVFVTSAWATQYFVKPDGGTTTSGTSWSTAFNNPQLALNAAGVTVIWVAAGTYKPGTSQSSSFTFPGNGIKMYGGFTVGDSALSQRNPLANLTILSGDLNASHQTDSSDCWHVVQINSSAGVIDENTQLDGFVITSGYADGGGT